MWSAPLHLSASVSEGLFFFFSFFLYWWGGLKGWELWPLLCNYTRNWFITVHLHTKGSDLIAWLCMLYLSWFRVGNNEEILLLRIAICFSELVQRRSFSRTLRGYIWAKARVNKCQSYCSSLPLPLSPPHVYKHSVCPLCVVFLSGSWINSNTRVSLMTTLGICIDKCLSLSSSPVGKGQGASLLFLKMAHHWPWSSGKSPRDPTLPIECLIVVVYCMSSWWWVAVRCQWDEEENLVSFRFPN